MQNTRILENAHRVIARSAEFIAGHHVIAGNNPERQARHCEKRSAEAIPNMEMGIEFRIASSATKRLSRNDVLGFRITSLRPQ